MRIVVIGGSGKVGQAVVRELRDESNGRTSHDVTVLDRGAGPAVDGVRHLVGDQNDFSRVMTAVEGADAIIHLAAIVPARWQPVDVPDNELFQQNTTGVYLVHEAARLQGIRRVVSTSSVAVLGSVYTDRPWMPEYLPIDEEHPCHPQGPYALSKRVGELIAMSFTDRSAMETVVLRPAVVRTPAEMVELQRQGGHRATRLDAYSYIDARDFAAAYRLAAERPLVGHHVFWTVADDSIIGEPVPQAVMRFAPQLEPMLQEIDDEQSLVTNDLAKEVLGWQPRYSWRRLPLT